MRRLALGAQAAEPWLVVAPSALLRQVGCSGMGLYAARPFKRGQLLGRMGGRILGHYPSARDAIASPAARAHCGDKLVALRAAGRGYNLVDAEHAGAPFIQYANDGRTRRRPNTALTEGGYLIVTNAAIPGFSLPRTLAQNSRAELLFEYGDDYWASHRDPSLAERGGQSVTRARPRSTRTRHTTLPARSPSAHRRRSRRARLLG